MVTNKSETGLLLLTLSGPRLVTYTFESKPPLLMLGRPRMVTNTSETGLLLLTLSGPRSRMVTNKSETGLLLLMLSGPRPRLDTSTLNVQRDTKDEYSMPLSSADGLPMATGTESAEENSSAVCASRETFLFAAVIGPSFLKLRLLVREQSKGQEQTGAKAKYSMKQSIGRLDPSDPPTAPPTPLQDPLPDKKATS
eukprot:700397-Pelagomonas_calceolata.AAC.5